MTDRGHDKLCNHYEKDFSHICYIDISALNILSKKFPTTHYIESLENPCLWLWNPLNNGDRVGFQTTFFDIVHFGKIYIIFLCLPVEVTEIMTQSLTVIENITTFLQHVLSAFVPFTV